MFEIRTDNKDILNEYLDINGYRLEFRLAFNRVYLLYLCQKNTIVPYSENYFRPLHIPVINIWMEEMVLKYV